jgi:transposase-like protein
MPDEQFYRSVLVWLKDQLTNKPTVLVTDRELALMSAIADVFPRAVNLVCRWHTHKDVLAKTIQPFP